MTALHRQCVRALALLLAAVAGAAWAGAPMRVVVPLAEVASDTRPVYPLAVLRLALERSGQPHLIRPAIATMPQSRAIRMVQRGDIDVMWTVTTRARERELRPIRFPIDRGMLGWRVLMVRKNNSARFAAIDSLDALAPTLGAQGHDWPDLTIMRANGMRVAASPTYEGLFHMLARGHVDHVGRSVAEAPGELSLHGALPLEIEPRLLLRYPSALYFFVHPRNEALARAIEIGLERAHRDGSFQRLFDAHYGAALTTLGLERRTVLELANPELPRATPLARRELWYAPERRR